MTICQPYPSLNISLIGLKDKYLVTAGMVVLHIVKPCFIEVGNEHNKSGKDESMQVIILQGHNCLSASPSSPPWKPELSISLDCDTWCMFVEYSDPQDLVRVTAIAISSIMVISEVEDYFGD